MKKLSKELFYQSVQTILMNGREIEIALLNHHFFLGDEQKVISELKKYQNSDGGFGHAFESDIRLSESSPIVTSQVLRKLTAYDQFEEAQVLIKKAINYLEKTYVKERNGWYAIDHHINNAPHTPWWHFNEDEGMTVIDHHWGNPNAEIIAYLIRYKALVKKLDVDRLVNYAIEHILNKKQFESFFEIICYQKLYDEMKDERLKLKIEEAINQLVIYDETIWEEYVPKPLDFVNHPNYDLFGINPKKRNDQLDFLVSKLETETVIKPYWDPAGQMFYQGEMEPAYLEWQGVLTLETLIILDHYGRIRR